jgi:acetamidase/formamidase
MLLRSHEMHRVWDRALAPRIVVDSGSVVTFETVNLSSERFSPSTRVEDLPTLLARLPPPSHRLTGPVYVRGAKPGDTIEVEVLALQPGAYGYTAFFPGRGLLPDDFTEPGLKVWRLDGDRAELRPGVTVPLEPFLGVMGVAPAVHGPVSTIAQGPHGGNLDIKQLTVGARLFLPVMVEGALFSCGDGHAAQGDGEVCVNAIETDMVATLRLTVHSGRRTPEAQLYRNGPLLARTNHTGWFAATGHGADLMTATRAAVRHMIDHLVSERGLRRDEAYVLCSVAVDLKISQVVNAPHWGVSAFLPLCVFSETVPSYFSW